MTDGDDAILHARHLLVCREVLRDPFAPGAAYSLRGLVVFLQPNDDIGYPLAAESLVLFAQVFGDAGQYDFWVDLVFVEDDGSESHVTTYGPMAASVRPGQFVEALTFPISNVPFPQPGIYEFRLRRDAVQEPLATERLLLKG